MDDYDPDRDPRFNLDNPDTYPQITKNLSEAAGLEIALDWLQHLLDTDIMDLKYNADLLYNTLDLETETRLAGYIVGITCFLTMLTDLDHDDPPKMKRLAKKTRAALTEAMPWLRAVVDETVKKTT
jgi:hypothetical protein